MRFLFQKILEDRDSEEKRMKEKGTVVFKLQLEVYSSTSTTIWNALYELFLSETWKWRISWVVYSRIVGIFNFKFVCYLPVWAWDYISKYWHTCIQVPSITDRLAMSTPPNNERSPRKWLKQKFRSVFSSSRSPSPNLEVRSKSTNVPPINSPSDSPRISADRTGSV